MIIAPLTASDKVVDFECGDADISRYIKGDALRHSEMGVMTTLVAAIPGDNPTVVGYISFHVSEHDSTKVPRAMKTKSRYNLPIVRVVYLGVSSRHKRQGIGRNLLYTVYARSLSVSDSAACAAVGLQARDNPECLDFYARCGMVPLHETNKLDLYITMAAIKQLGLPVVTL